MKQYLHLHRESSQREFYVFHTDRQHLNIHERKWLGIRPARWIFSSANHWFDNIRPPV